MKSYKGFSGKHRMYIQKKINQAIKDNVLESPLDKKCEICGQVYGIREYHCYDYTESVALDSLQCLCWKCHRNLHAYEIGEQSRRYKHALDYFERIENENVIFKPVYTKYFTQEMERKRISKRKQREKV